jgi:hypothetical protein
MPDRSTVSQPLWHRVLLNSQVHSSWGRFVLEHPVAIAESFLRSWHSQSLSRNPPFYLQFESSFTCSQRPANRTHRVTKKSTPHPNIIFLWESISNYAPLNTCFLNGRFRAEFWNRNLYAFLVSCVLIVLPTSPYNGGTLKFTKKQTVETVSSVLQQGCINPWQRVAMANTFGTVVPNIGEPTVGNLISVTVLAPRIMRWRLHFFFNLCTSVLQRNQFSRTHRLVLC